MAKPAKFTEPEITDKIVNKFVHDILERFEAIESARGVYANRARQERDGMAVVYESLAQRGISQKAAKVHIRIVRLLQKAKGLIAELEAEDAKAARRLAKAQGDKQQLALWNDLPTQKKARRPKEAPRQSDGWEETPPVGSA